MESLSGVETLLTWRKYLELRRSVSGLCLKSRAEGRSKALTYIYGHTKHLFTGNSLLTAHNLYNYSMISDAFKVIVSKAPVSYFETCYQVSSVNPSRLISSTCTLSSLSSNFHHMIPLLWNGFLAVNKITKFSLCGFKSFKRSLKSFIVSMQSSFEPDEWHKFNNNLIDYCNYFKFQCLELPSNQPRVRH